MNIIFLSGKTGSGKDTVAEYISKKYEYKIFRISDSLKEITSILTGSDLIDCYKNKGKIPKGLEKIKLDLGQYQQKIESSLRLGIHPDIFLYSMWKKISLSKSKNIIIVDGGLKNEYDFFVKKKALSIRINRSFEFRKKSLGNRDPYHETEIQLDEVKFDYIIENDYTTTKYLFENVDKILNV